MTATANPAPKSRKPRPKPSRKVRLEGPAGQRVLVITETEELRAGPRVTVTRYMLAELPADFGRSFEVEKLAPGGERYAVNLGGGIGNSDICECLGHLRHAPKTPCRHVSALKALTLAGRI